MNFKMTFLMNLDGVSIYARYVTYLKALAIAKNANLELKEEADTHITNVDLKVRSYNAY